MKFVKDHEIKEHKLWGYVYNSFMFAISFNIILLIPSLQVHNYRNKAINEWK